MPKVSVLLTVYKAGDVVRTPIESIINQSFHDFEFLIILDGEHEETESVIKEYGDPRIRFFKNKTNMGLARSLNRLVYHSDPNCEYLAIAEHDDHYYPYRLFEQVEFLDNNKEYGLVSGIADHFNGKKITYKFPGMLVEGEDYPEGNKMFLLNFREQIKVANSCMMIRKKIHMENGLYFSMHYENISVDWSYIQRFSLISKIKGLPRSFVRLDRDNSRGTVSSDRKVQSQNAYEVIQNFKFENSELISRSTLKYAINTQLLKDISYSKKNKFIKVILLMWYATVRGDKRFSQRLIFKIRNFGKKRTARSDSF